MKRKRNITFRSFYDKLVEALIEQRDDEITVLNITINGIFYSRKQCARHEWLLYCAVKKHLYE